MVNFSKINKLGGTLIKISRVVEYVVRKTSDVDCNYAYKIKVYTS